MNVQFKKGVLELCVLVLLNKQDHYGYELVQKISAQIHISEGSVYPLLRRLTKDGYFTTYLKESSEGPSRKYYALTDSGKDQLHKLLCEWEAFTTGVNQLLMNEGDQID
ncbi:PadR family transcriptional regulator [Shouchella lonarensis]|uniref:Transcriptional regulator, PadR family n=1 Tax=Shouchella lonarensis TaxID=1464122 RepID=A0A1G6HDP0_9BACI|nr:PadR family transcriptional regulator [Shouchella lonarensis]SDB92208.1 transcriptional regulator, PadR family [Shouchella lonarensis]